ncbi:NHLP leader peptide family RiPP precursor [Nostoc sp. C052]|uniref:NHLP leader peptide family RiPP precursor n=1 Tax=Nostoc sp. C052 TaxID=2576902 RepID=UPI0021189B42|nr:NHLP leader peptide family RiPP precursor [Nostoc sp. C052]
MSTTEPTPTPEMNSTGRMPNLEAQLITQAIQDPAFWQRLLNNPKAVLAEQGLNVPDDVQINVLQESATQYYLVLPALELPTASGEVAELSDAELEAVAGGANLDSQNANWTGCASGQSGCVATNGCNAAAQVGFGVASFVGATATGLALASATAALGTPAAMAAGGAVAIACAGAATATKLA